VKGAAATARGRAAIACCPDTCETESAADSLPFMPIHSRDLIRELEADGWRFIGATGSHHHFKHPSKPGKVTVPHPKRDLHPKTVRSVYRQAALKEPR
jgi:predicted RNA binding protein YcfA (HicA-like mRNA interferase family)